jgi:acetyl-CoA acyltransferase
MKEAVIVSGARTAVGKAPRGTLRTTRPDDLAATAITEALRRAPGFDPTEVEDVILGCAKPEGPQGFNIARVAAMRAGLPVTVAGQTVNRFCSSGLQTIASAAERIMCGFGIAIVAGGAESMSLTMSNATFSPNPTLVDASPEHYISMGLTAERVAAKYGISRDDQDDYALRSHTRALNAVQSGRFDPEIAPVKVTFSSVRADGRPDHREIEFRRDEGPRADTSALALASLKPVFARKGTVTAGNSSQTSDGAAAVLVMERQRAEELNLKPLARFVGFAVAGVPPEIMGIGPVESIPKVLKLTGLSLDDIGLIELNEAFAAQTLAVMRTIGLDPDRVNVNGGAIALGHPLGASGTKLTVQLIYEMLRRNVRYGMVTMCIGGGMGASGIFENLQ